MNTTQDFYTEVFVNAPREKVWEAFVQSDTYFHAFYGANIISSFQIGEQLEYVAMADGEKVVHIYGKVLEYEPGLLLSYTDHPGPMYREDHAELESRVKVSFESLGEVTRLCLTNDQFTENNPMQAEAKQWFLILSNFKTYVETGSLMNLDQQ